MESSKLYSSIVELASSVKNEISVRDKRISDLEAKINMYQTLKDINLYMGSTLDLDEIIRMVHDVLTGVMGVSTCATLASIGDEQSIEQSSVNKDSHNLFDYNFFKFSDIVMGATQSKLVVSNLAKQRLHNLSSGSVMVANIVRGSNKYGSIVVYYDTPNMITNTREEFFSLIATQLGVFFENATLYYKMREASITDGLTQIRNRSYLNNLIAEGHYDKASEVGVIMLDIDNFKKVNDTYGHQVGDEVLKFTAKTAQTIAKMYSGRAFRYGGEEITCTFRDKDPMNIIKAAKSILTSLRGMVFESNGQKFSVTASIGICKEVGATGVHTIINHADEALYFAKHNGKNKVVAYRDFSFPEMPMSEQ